VNAVDFDFETATSTRWMPGEVETFEAADAVSAVRKLEIAFGNDHWEGNTSAARSYLESHLSELLELFSASPELSANSPGVWRQVLQLSRPAEVTASQESGGTEKAKSLAEESKRRALTVLALLSSLPDHSLPAMISHD
jgi:hypothetical protein